MGYRSEVALTLKKEDPPVGEIPVISVHTRYAFAGHCAPKSILRLILSSRITCCQNFWRGRDKRVEAKIRRIRNWVRFFFPFLRRIARGKSYTGFYKSLKFLSRS